MAERDGAGSLGLWDSDGLEAALAVNVGLVEMVAETEVDCVEVTVEEAEREGLAVQLRVSDEVGELLGVVL